MPVLSKDDGKDLFYQQVYTYIAEHGLLPAGCAVVAGVSGGADSLALLLLLCRLRDSLGFTVVAAHLNHQLRGQAADDDEEFVRRKCRELAVPLVSRTADIGQLAASRKIGLEEAGRQARHSFFNEIAEQLEAGIAVQPEQPGPSIEAASRRPARIALAHHLDDQTETIMLHLGRGSGLDGLTGMKPQNGRLIRPLLGQTRQAIETWLTGQGHSWRQDASNLEPAVLRNRLRLQVIPAWRDALGYDPAPLLGRTARSLAEDQQLLADLTGAAAGRCRAGAALRAAAVLELAPALQNRVLRLFWLERTGSGKDLSFEHIRLLRTWLPTAASGQQLCLPGQWRMCLDGQLLYLRPARPGDDQAAGVSPVAGRIEGEIKLNLPGMTKIPQLNLQITALLIENESEIVYNNAMEYFRLERIRGSVIRHRLPGDQIRPYGRTGGKTLKKFLNEQRIRPDLRERLPLIALGNEIVWLPGHAAGSFFAGRPGDGKPGPLVRLEMQSLDQMVQKLP